jgi:hypothetical protein
MHMKKTFTWLDVACVAAFAIIAYVCFLADALLGLPHDGTQEAWIGAAIGAALAIGGGIANAIGGAARRRAQRKMLEERKARVTGWYDRAMNEDPTKRASTRYLLTKTEEAVRNRNRAARGRAAVMGGTQDAVIAAQEINANAMADTTAKIVAANEARRDKAEEQYRRDLEAVENQQAAMKADEAGQTADAAASIMKTGASIATAVDSANSGSSSKEPTVAEKYNAAEAKQWGDKVLDDYYKDNGIIKA